MNSRGFIIISLPMLAFVLAVESVAAAPAIERNYKKHCSGCHGKDRLGGTGPALLPENLGRLKSKAAVKVIRDGRPATQMPGFGDRLGADAITALVEWIYTPLKIPPQWGAREIRRSHKRYVQEKKQKPVLASDIDPLNLFVVVESGDHHVTILNGDRLEPITRIPTRYALHGGPKFSPDGRYVYFASRDGWVSKYDLHALRYVAEIRAGINTRNAAVSSDGRLVIVGNYLPHTLVLLNADDLSLIKILPVRGIDGKESRVSAVYDAPPRKRFVIALKDIPELWEIPYAEEGDTIYQGLVHDYRYSEGLAEQGSFPIRRIQLDDYLDDFFFDPPYHHIIGAARTASNGQVVNLLVGRKVAEVDLPGLPHLGSGIMWRYKNIPVMATPNLKEGVVSIINMTNWKTLKKVKTLGPGFFMRSHENTPYAWVDVFFGPHRDAIHVIDKRTLKIIKTLKPEPGKTVAHVEFTRDGRYALVSLWEQDGALIVYDSATLKEIKRLPMKKPSGKYNVYNKIKLSTGTSH